MNPLNTISSSQSSLLGSGQVNAVEDIRHILALHPQARAMLYEETQEKVYHVYVRLIKWGDRKHDIPPNLTNSPLGMIPHKSRLPRCILDLFFKLKTGKISFSSVIEITIKLAVQESMNQLGSSLRRLVNIMADQHDPNHSFQFCKLEIKDGFWRLAVNKEDA